jgi:hypothetical protein
VHSFRRVIVVILFYILINNIYLVIILLVIIILPSLAYNYKGYRRLGNYRATKTSLLIYRADGLFRSIYIGILLGRVLGISVPKIIGYSAYNYRASAL